MSLEQYIIENNLTILKEYDGHIKSNGKSANEERNKYYLVKDNNIDNLSNDTLEQQNTHKPHKLHKPQNKYYIMECHKNDNSTIYFKFDKLSLPQVLTVYDNCNPTWFQSGNGYIITHIKYKGQNTCINLHQYLMNYYGQKKSVIKNECNDYTTKNHSVDHINRNPLDNRISNLRIINQSHQNHNQKDRDRGTNLATDFQQLKQYIPKNIYYRKQSTDAKGLTHGEHFEVEIKFTTPDNTKHRMRRKTTKSQETQLPYKLIQAIKIKYQIIYESKPLQNYLDIFSQNDLDKYTQETKDDITSISQTYNIANCPQLLDLHNSEIKFNKKLEKLKCPHCEKLLTGKSSLNRHITTKHTTIKNSLS
jgi:hypothetical protein